MDFRVFEAKDHRKSAMIGLISRISQAILSSYNPTYILIGGPEYFIPL